jgi:hypothetical protein
VGGEDEDEEEGRWSEAKKKEEERQERLKGKRVVNRQMKRQVRMRLELW